MTADRRSPIADRRPPTADRLLGPEGEDFCIALCALNGGRLDIADRALQLRGGHGHLSAYGSEKIVRDQRVHQILEGTNEIMRVIVARGLTEVFG